MSINRPHLPHLKSPFQSDELDSPHSPRSYSDIHNILNGSTATAGHHPNGENGTQEEEEDEFVYAGQDTPLSEDGDAEEEGIDYKARLADIISEDGDEAESTKWTGVIPQTSGLPKINGHHAPESSSSAAFPAEISSPQSSSDLPFPSTPPTPSRSVTDSPSSAAFPRRPAFAHPQISRLRSTSTQQLHHQRRFPSASTQSALGLVGVREGDAFGSRRSSLTASILLDIPPSLGTAPNPLSPGGSGTVTPIAPSSNAGASGPTETFGWTPLRRVSSTLNQHRGGGVPQANLMGVPTVMAISGIIAVGTSKGWVMVFDFSQNLRCVCGTDAIAKESGAVTAVAISQDHTFVAVGHALGSIHLYSLLKPSQPARSVPPTTLALVHTGRKEGHLIGARILHLGFIGLRHTAIVSSDETGLAFYHSLGKVLMLASTDIIRMLGRYPDPSSQSPLSPALSVHAPLPKHRRPTTILDMASLPLGPSSHPSDAQSLVALLTPTKLVIVGLKPTPRTWWRATAVTKEVDGVDEFSRTGVVAWFPSVAVGSAPVAGKTNGSVKPLEEQEGSDPVLAFAWSNTVRLVRVAKGSRSGGGEEGEERTKSLAIEFVEVEGWTTDELVLGLQWYNQKVIFILTAHHVDIYDVSTRQLIGRDSQDIRNVISHDYYSSAFQPPAEVLSYSGSFKAHKQKLFVLTYIDLRVGAVLSWADRILNLMQPGTILEAIELTTSYFLGQSDASTIALPSAPSARRQAVEPKLREILTASLEFVFSEDRLRDGSHNDSAIIQRLFEGLVGTCVRACVAIGDVDWLFDELYERYETNGIENIFLERIEPFVLSGSVHALPPSVSQRLIAIHEERGQYEAAQRIIWHVDPEFLDINQTLRLCQKHKLIDALIYVYARSLHDFVAPIVELLSVIRLIQRSRKHRPRCVADSDDARSFASTSKSDPDIEASVPDAYKVYTYLSQALAGLSYPSRDPLPYEEAALARKTILAFLFSGKTLVWPEIGGRPVLTSDDDGGEESPYPYLQALLRFDAEAMLDALDLAFEESFNDDETSGKSISRQAIVDLLLEVMSPDSPDYSAVDMTFLRIFAARNLPKYPQFIKLSSPTLHSILVGLAKDHDQSTVEDRQLAAEYLLSTYSPPDTDEIVALFESAGFFRILRSIYRGERKWAALASTYLRDPDVGADLFGFLRETLALAAGSNARQRQDLVNVVLDAVPALLQAHEGGLHETADLIDTFLPNEHAEVLARLASSPWRQFAYLRCLLEPASPDAFPPSEVLANRDRAPSTRLGTPQRLQYLSLLCQHQPTHVIRFLETESQNLATLPEALEILDQIEVYDAAIWAIDRQGDTAKALDRIDDTLESRTDLLVQTLTSGFSDGEEEEEEEHQGGEGEGYRPRGDSLLGSGKADTILDDVTAITKVAIQICVSRTSGPTRSQTLTGDELWFRLLAALVSTVRSIRAISPARPSDRASSYRRQSGSSIICHDDEPQPLSPRASDALSNLIPTALSSLVSTTSTRDVSFPNLMRRLIDSNARSPAANRSYAEFKAIVTSMLDTYAFEGDLLELTSKISSQDLFEHVERLTREREKGWRSGGELCEECCQPVWGPEGQMSPPMSRSASVSMVVDAFEMTGRPRMKKRPSLKGKEVDDWIEGLGPELTQPALEPPRGIVVGRDGRVWHRTCHLSRISFS